MYRVLSVLYYVALANVFIFGEQLDQRVARRKFIAMNDPVFAAHIVLTILIEYQIVTCLVLHTTQVVSANRLMTLPPEARPGLVRIMLRSQAIGALYSATLAFLTGPIWPWISALYCAKLLFHIGMFTAQAVQSRLPGDLEHGLEEYVRTQDQGCALLGTDSKRIAAYANEVTK